MNKQLVRMNNWKTSSKIQYIPSTSWRLLLRLINFPNYIRPQRWKASGVKSPVGIPKPSSGSPSSWIDRILAKLISRKDRRTAIEYISSWKLLLAEDHQDQQKFKQKNWSEKTKLSGSKRQREGKEIGSHHLDLHPRSLKKGSQHHRKEKGEGRREQRKLKRIKNPRTWWGWVEKGDYL